MIGQPALIGNESKYVLECLEKEWLSQGPFVSRFEQEFAKVTNTKYAMACSSGTTALHLAMLALNVQPGDHVIVPALTFIATANAIAYCGGIPVPCDVDASTWCLDPVCFQETVERLTTAGKEVVGVVPVHLFGTPAAIQWITAVAQMHDLWVVEDTAQAHGARFNGQPVGSFGDIGVFSFYGNKIVTCGEGGMVVTNRDFLRDRIKLFRGQGQTTRYFHEVIGYNYRLTDLQAAVGLAQLENLEVFMNRRDVIGKQYRDRLIKFECQGEYAGSKPVEWMMAVLVPAGVNRDAVIVYMDEDDIETRPMFPLISDQPPYRSESPKNAADISKRGIMLPTHPRMTDGDVDRVCDSFERAVAACKP